MRPTADPIIVVIGLGYVGLPLAIALADHFSVIGYDIDPSRIDELQKGVDRTAEVEADRLAHTSLRLSADPAEVSGADIYIVTVPTPVDENRRPDLSALLSASHAVGKMIDPLRPAIVVYESTVYPGVTEEICGAAIAQCGLQRGKHFLLGYSPERINPGDREHGVERIVKVISGETEWVMETLAAVYGRITSEGVFRAVSIKAAEGAKVIENAQRDINIAFMNEVARIFSRLDLSIWNVLDAANTKWNFLPFEPGLVGGHCIGVDPYYLSHLAEQLGHEPRVILAGREINDSMGDWIAGELHSARRGVAGKAIVLGIAFKENVPDLRNSKVVDLVRGLQQRGHDVVVHDPLADIGDARREYGIELTPGELAGTYDLVVCAVPHDAYRAMDAAAIEALLAPGGLAADLKGIWRERRLGAAFEYWSL